jgi:hypothetical protein
MIPDSTFLSELNMSDRLREMLNRALDRRNHYADCRTQGSNYWARCDCESPLKDKRYKAATFGTVKDVTIEQLSALIGRGVGPATIKEWELILESAGSEDVARERSRELLRKQIKGWQARIKGMRKAIKTNQAKIVSLKAELELLG